MELFYAICVILIILLLSAICFMGCYRIFKSKNKQIEQIPYTPTETIKILLEEKSLDKVNGLIDSLIKESITMFRVLQGFNEETYITDKISQRMSNYSFATVKGNMTPAIKEAIGLYYDISDEKKLDDVLKLRIKLHLIAEVVNQNIEI